MATEPVKHLFTVDEYEAMGTAGLFSPDQRLELIEGEVIEMAPIGPPHASTVGRLTRVLVQALGDRAIVWVQNPVRLSDISEPQPDLAVLRARDDFYASGHPRPEDVLLAIEVSDTTLRWDRGVKTPLYARAGIRELWVVDVNEHAVEVCAMPTGDGYAEVRLVGPGDSIAIGGLEGATVSVSDFLG